MVTLNTPSFLKTFLLIVIICFVFQNVWSKVKIEKDIAYAEGGEKFLLDIYHQTNDKQLKDVIIFIHGGAWNSGNKNMYWFLGRNFARKGKVMVIINYPLSPKVKYDAMALSCAKAYKWVVNNIHQFGGDANRIFLMGHSAGAHLAALINQDNYYLSSVSQKNQIKGLILNDPFGLNIYEYMKAQKETDDEYMPGFYKVFGEDEQEWKEASPYFTIDKIQNAYQLFVGSKTYPSIKIQTPAFYNALKERKKKVYFESIKGKKHIGMISHMVFSWNPMYRRIISFMNEN